jgi:ABC-2 type transport system ATP-binding protein
LLRLLSGVSAPTSGRLRIEGRIAPLIGIGVGFNPELTGRENVHVNGRLLGMTAEELDGLYGDIVAFSEIGEFVEAPVKFYSSGMFLRLAFSVAIHTSPNVMLVDEILAVGDAGFQAKCFDRMRTLQRSGSTVVVVTHNLAVLERLTERTLVLDRGRLEHDGSTDEGIDLYHSILQRHREEEDVRGGGRWEDKIAALQAVPARVSAALVNGSGKQVSQVDASEGCRVAVDVAFDDEVEAPLLQLLVEHPITGPLYFGASAPHAYTATHGPDRPLHATIDFRSLPLLSGTYTLRALVRPSSGTESIAARSPRYSFHVSNPAMGLGYVELEPEFSIEGNSVPGVSPPTLLGE